MPLPQPEPGLVIRYSFLFSDGSEKDRPAVIVASTEIADGIIIVRVLPVTHTPPESGRESESLEIPAKIKKYLNLDGERSWVRLSEVNRFEWPGFDLRQISGRDGKIEYGFLPPAFFEIIRSRTLELHKNHLTRLTERDDKPA